MRHDEVMNPAWLTSSVCGTGPVTRLQQREWAFWCQLIALYLHPLSEDPEHVRLVHAVLRNLRNNVVFGFALTSAIWIALTMQLEVSVCDDAGNSEDDNNRDDYHDGFDSDYCRLPT